jgi:RNA polymerase sigma-70 factor (ECF subfamily)
MKPLCDAPCLALARSNVCAGKRCLVERARKGNRAARESVFSRLYAPVFHQASMLCRDHSDAEDLTQTALLHVLENLVQLRDCPHLLGWTWRVVQNTHRMSLRQSKFAPSAMVGLVENTTSAADLQSTEPFQHLVERELQQAISERIGELPPSLKEVLDLRVFEGKTTAQAAKSLRISKEAVRTRLARARRALRSSLAAPVNGHAHDGPSPSPRLDQDAVVRLAATSHGLEFLAVHHLEEKGVVSADRLQPRYSIYELIDPVRTRRLLDGEDDGFPLCTCRVDLLRSGAGWKLHAVYGPATAAASGRGQTFDLLRAIEHAFTLLFEK